MKIRLLLFFICVSLCAFNVNAQEKKYIPQKNSLGLSSGAFVYSGRFAVGTSIFDHSSLYGSAFLRHKIFDKVFVRVELLGGKLRADNTEEESQIDKTTGAFNTTLVELSLKGEYDFMDLSLHKFSPYVTAGVGTYGLLNYHSTKGQKEGSDKIGFVVPVGGGIRYKLNERLKIFGEGSLRFFAKNLDNHIGEGVTNPNSYYSFGAGIIYELTPYNRLW